MPKKQKIIIASLVILLLLGSGLAYIFTREETPASEEGNGFLNGLFPSVDERGGPITGTPFVIDGSAEGETAKLKKLTSVSIADFKEVGEGRVRYVEKATGHLYEISGDKKDKIRISNTTIPKIFKVVWSPSGDSAVLGYLDNFDAEYFSAKFTGTSTEGAFLPFGAVPQTYAPHKDRFLYWITIGERSTLIASDPDNANKVDVYSTPFTDFVTFWPTPDIISLLTRPSGMVEGNLYEINLAKGSFTKTIGGILGLDALWSPNGENLLISQYSKAQQDFSLEIISKDASNNSLSLTRTLVQKCVWGEVSENIIYCGVPTNIAPAIYPDDWFKGKVSFKDQIIKINIETEKQEKLLSSSDLDIQKMGIDQEEKYLYFIDKNDETLWALELEL